MSHVTAILVALVAIGPSLAAAQQSLAEVARAEAARRKTVPQAAKVYTNSDLKADVSAPSVPTAPPPAATAPGTAAASGNATPDAPAPPPRDQAYWSARMKEARTTLDRSRMFAEALQSRINALNADFVNRDDPAQRAVIEQDRKTALAELDRVKKDIEEQTKAITAIEDEARRAGVPAGWLR